MVTRQGMQQKSEGYGDSSLVMRPPILSLLLLLALSAADLPWPSSVAAAELNAPLVVSAGALHERSGRAKVAPAGQIRGLQPGAGVEPGSPGSGVVPDLMIRFGHNSSELLPYERAQLDELGRALQTDALRRYRFQVAGHASSDETDKLRLSEHRAEVVVIYLNEAHGIARTRLEVEGYGDTELADPDDPGSAGGRRVEVRTLDEVPDLDEEPAAGPNNFGAAASTIPADEITQGTIAHMKPAVKRESWQEQRVALVVGIASYPSGFQLLNGEADARIMASKLVSLGFEVYLGVNIDRSQFADLLESVSESLKGADLALFYFAGHGAEINAHNLLWLVDARWDDTEKAVSSGVPLNRVLATLGAHEVTSLIFIDTCRDDAFSGSDGAATDEARVALAGLGRAEARPDMLIAYATAPGSVALDGSSGNSPFAQALVQHLGAPGADIHQVLTRVRRDVIKITDGRQVPWVNDALITEIYLGDRPPFTQTPTVAEVSSESRWKIALDSGVSPELFLNADLSMNGEPVALANYDTADNTVTLLAPNNVLRDGLNILERGKRRVLLWWQEQRLSVFEEPYGSSHALIVAIDDYDRSEDPLRRGPTGLRELGNMRNNAKELKQILLNLGFDEKNIVELYDHEATSERIDYELREFYEGKSKAGAGRLLFYFGGHGAGRDKRGYLVTYDYDGNQPTSTAFLMSKLAGEHFAHVEAHHVLAVLDACSAGLALPGMSGLGETDAQRRKRFERLALIRNDMQEPARNLLVAGTDDQDALYDEQNGGIFTRALIEGLRGAADLNGDGLIRYDELKLHVSQRVIAEAESRMVRQSPSAMTATLYGRGSTLFIVPETSLVSRVER